MSMLYTVRLLLFIAAASGLAAAPHVLAEDEAARPNFIVVFVDDLGYGDLGCYGAVNIETPNLDAMSQQGVRFTSFYAHTVCGPSRAALMTGCYPIRTARRNNQQAEIHPELHTEEITIAELLQGAGYATGCFGKWDLAGHRQKGFIPELMPNHQGFDYFFGTPSSNDRNVNLMRNEELIEQDAPMATLTERYTDEAIGFIRRNKDRPFFVYLPHSMPHTRLAASPVFRGASRRGLYGDVVEEIDANLGRIIETLMREQLAERTYVIFMSDNGPWHLRGHDGGSAGPLRSAKTSTWEGGVRVPAIVWAPGRVAPGHEVHAIGTTMDILPTLCALAGAQAPDDRIIDGVDLSAVWRGEPASAEINDRPFFYYQHRQLQAVRAGPWKLHIPRQHDAPGQPNWSRHVAPGDSEPITEPLLYHLERDIGERHNVAGKHPDVVRRLMDLADQAKLDLGNLDQMGAGARVFD